MMNFAHSTDVYRIYAGMMAMNARQVPKSQRHAYCIYASRKENYTYARTHERNHGEVRRPEDDTG